MEAQSKKWYNRWWVLVLAMLLGSFVGWLLKGCWLDAWSGLNI